MSESKYATNTTGGDVAHLREMVKDIDFCMLTTLDEQGNPHSRPMSTNRHLDFDGDLWFFIYGDSHKALEIRREPKVNASFADPSNQSWVSMTGTAELVRDRRKMEELWQPQLRAWFPKGLDEPDIALLKVNVEKAEYWDSPSSTIAHVYSLASALVTGKPADLGDNKKLDLRGGTSREGSASRPRGAGDGRASRGSAYSPERNRARKSGSGTKGLSSSLALLAGAVLGGVAMCVLDPERGNNTRARL
ncbi:MAG TPA: pyridoxamine 5'-phosphate oxidase family protein [Pyrinomonadaceae bacterium]|nr:pyridoxamine 5'-phosphate oxidase family protein [Pyrinomonadaceae bacterium]